jgi:hypothetical protein
MYLDQVNADAESITLTACWFRSDERVASFCHINKSIDLLEYNSYPH